MGRSAVKDNYIFWKDTRSVFLGCNLAFANVAGVAPNEIKGKTDFDLPWGPRFAKLYRKRDRVVLKGSPLLNLTELQIQASGKLVEVKVDKYPIYSETGDLIGLMGSYYTINDFNKNYHPVKLPEKQRCCLNFLAKGLTAKQIAAKMALSHRTVETYIQILKDKFRCQNKIGLIIEAYNCGLIAE